MESNLARQGETADLKNWVGRRQDAVDIVTAGPVAALAALLGHDAPPWQQGAVPPLGHWFYCLERAAQADLDADGHEKRGRFLPPVDLPRRMWAGGRVSFLHQLRMGAVLRRASTVAGVTEKQGRTGRLVFVAVDHRYEDGKGLAIVERQDLVFREAPHSWQKAVPLHVPPSGEADWERRVQADPALLFRYSALTFNAHRIHYDRDYCKEQEGYPGLVAHGPLVATLLSDLFLRHNPGKRVEEFSYRAHSPLFDVHPFQIKGRATAAGAEMWALTPEGQLAMTAEIRAG